MKRVGIVTLNGYFNYGNRLQNYALQETLKSMGFNVDTIVIKSTPKPIVQDNKSRFKKVLEKSPIEIYKILENKIWHKLNEKQISQSKLIRTNTFKKFTYEYINETSFAISEHDLPNNLSENYDYFVTGSDQVWNPHYINDCSIYFLTFAEKFKRIAYAPSFGVSEIKSEFRDKYQQWLLGMHELSVREEDGAKIIKELTGREVPVLVDPTLLLTKEKWLSIAKEAPNKPQKNFLLTYFLGGVSNNHKKLIKNFAKQNGLEIINLGDIKEKETYKSGPSEFIDYINSCSVLFTDSFHGCVFSILLGKPFVVFNRVGPFNMGGRIDTLLSKFDLESRKWENILNPDDILSVDYSHVAAILENERNRSIEYLKNAMNIKDDNIE